MSEAIKKYRKAYLATALLVLSTLFSVSARAASSISVLESNPDLKKFLYEEPTTHFEVGFGASPIGLLQNRLLFGINLFQLHWIRHPWDIELLSATLAKTFARDNFVGSMNFLFRIAPKYQLMEHLSVGPMVGLEFVSFSDLIVRLGKGSLATQPEPFSTRGVVYGIMFSENFKLGENYSLKLNQLVYSQTYSTTDAGDGWSYIFERTDIEQDPNRELIKPSVVFMLEFALLF